MRHFISMSLFAGLLIGIAGLVFLHVGGLGGAALFAFGLMSVTLCQALLFTGKAGYLPYKESLQLIPMVLYNAIGCLITAYIAYYTMSEASLARLDTIMAAREAASWHGLIATSTGTGIIVTLALYGSRKGNYLPLLYGVPVFIMCGLPHCIADAFYYWVAILDGDFAMWMVGAWLLSVVGNYIGCNLPRWFMGKTFEM
ncbi:MAG: formate/nitrite transporter family protein [Alistipes sp.]|nr:formate/nitrite transporter family protein [Alistipes sp.]MBO7242083.1 formate/nitrite transporter family protein [Alistipes sp.]